jgi:prophage regulatory protein
MNDATRTDTVALLRLPEVRQRTGLSRSSIYALAARGEFPRPISLGRRSVAWVDAEISQWVSDRIRAARGEAA